MKGWPSFSSELSSQILFLRKSFGSRLDVFAPVNDLSALSKTGSEYLSMIPGKNNEVAITGGQILGDEYSEHVIKVTFSCRHFVFQPERIDTNNDRTDAVSFCEKGTQQSFAYLWLPINFGISTLLKSD